MLVIFDRYDRSPKDHERIRRADKGAVDFNITTSSKIPCRDAIMKSKTNNKDLVRVLSTYNLCNNVQMVEREKSIYSHDEADITVICYLLEAIRNGKNTVRVISICRTLMLWKAADQQTAGVGCVPNPRNARGPVASPTLVDVTNCQCNVAGKACSSHACSCHSEGLSCTPYCFCVSEAMCFNLVTKHDENEARFDNDDEGDSMED